MGQHCTNIGYCVVFAGCTLLIIPIVYPSVVKGRLSPDKQLNVGKRVLGSRAESAGWLGDQGTGLSETSSKVNASCETSLGDRGARHCTSSEINWLYTDGE